MPVNFSIKNVPEHVAERLRDRAARHHRSLQGELMAILEAAASSSALSTHAPVTGYAVKPESTSDGLLERLTAIVGDRHIEASGRLTREEAHDRRRRRADRG
jgi:plasmid stability protein